MAGIKCQVKSQNLGKCINFKQKLSFPIPGKQLVSGLFSQVVLFPPEMLEFFYFSSSD